MSQVDPIALFKGLTGALASGIELLAAIIIGLAVIEAVFRTAHVFLHPDLPPAAKENLRLRLGRWLAVALEFELGADILRSAIAPTWKEIGMLAAIAAIRTGLNYFLEKEIQRAAKSQAASDMLARAAQQPTTDTTDTTGTGGMPRVWSKPRSGDEAGRAGEPAAT